MQKICLSLVAILFCFQISLYAQYIRENNPDNKFNRKPKGFTTLPHKSLSDPAMDNYDVTCYKLDIAMERTSTYIAGSVTIFAKVVQQDLSVFKCELHSNHTVDSVKVNDELASFSRTGSILSISPSSVIPLNSLFNVQIYYNGTPPVGYFFSGMTNDYYNSYQVTWSLSEPFSAYEWFPCKQSLTDKADSAYIFVTTSNTNKVGSNGLLRNVVNLPNNKVRYEWITHYPIAYYLISVSISNYYEYNIYAKPANYPDSILVQNYIYNGTTYLNSQRTGINRTKDFINVYSEKYGLYPFHLEKYGHCTAPLGGGMEHQTMTTQYNFGFELTCHELSHQWFGNNVTCSNWSDIWLNEGFATYSEYIAYEALLPGYCEAWLTYVHNNVKSEPGGSIYVPPAETEDVWRIFDGRLSYDKGGAILHTLRFIINNDSLFFAVMKNYQTIFGGSTASAIDFKNVLEATTQMDFDYFFDQWYYGEGYPIFEITWNYANQMIYIKSDQTTSATTPLFTVPMEYKLYFNDGDTTIRLEQTAPTNEYWIPVNKTVIGIELDPNNWIINGLTGIYVSTVSKPENRNEAECNTYVLKDKLIVEMQNEPLIPCNYFIYNTLGQNVSRGTITTKKSEISLSGLKRGSYIFSTPTSKKLFIF